MDPQGKSCSEFPQSELKRLTKPSFQVELNLVLPPMTDCRSGWKVAKDPEVAWLWKVSRRDLLPISSEEAPLLSCDAPVKSSLVDIAREQLRRTDWADKAGRCMELRGEIVQHVVSPCTPHIQKRQREGDYKQFPHWLRTNSNPSISTVPSRKGASGVKRVFCLLLVLISHLAVIASRSRIVLLA